MFYVTRPQPIGKIKDYFYRVEFQQRGSPHIHMLVWIKDAPSISKHTVDKVTDFVNLYVTCQKNDEMADLVNYQTHRHAHTCKKK